MATAFKLTASRIDCHGEVEQVGGRGIGAVPDRLVEPPEREDALADALGGESGEVERLIRRAVTSAGSEQVLRVADVAQRRRDEGRGVRAEREGGGLGHEVARSTLAAIARPRASSYPPIPRAPGLLPRARTRYTHRSTRKAGTLMSETALITGASAGLGAELARLFARDKHDVILVARRRDKLDALAAELTAKHGVAAHVIAEDLASPGASERIAAAVQERGLRVDYLVNNAGFGTAGVFAELDPAREIEEIQVNVTALVHLTRIFLPAMIARKSGRVLNLGSTAGFQPGPFMAVYYATKAFVNSFTEALGFELKGTGVTATVSCPGATETEFAAVAGNDKSLLFKASAPMTAVEVAEHAYRAMQRGEAMAVPGLKNKAGIQSLRVAPRSVVLALAAKLNRPAQP